MHKNALKLDINFTQIKQIIVFGKIPSFFTILYFIIKQKLYVMTPLKKENMPQKVNAHVRVCVCKGLPTL